MNVHDLVSAPAVVLEPPLDSGGVAAAFRRNERRLWGIAYRLTGAAADADDIVQEGFARLAERPPAAGVPLGAWLVRVVVNLGLDALRRRRRSGYPGPWLPSPVALDEEEEARSESAGARYDRLESASIAFLLAMEALAPRQRAVLILCDAFDYTSQEAGDVLGMTAPNVRMALTRARRAMASYDRTRAARAGASREVARSALEAFFGYVRAGDQAGLERLLARDVRAMSDGGGEFASLGVPLVGRDDVCRFFLALSGRLNVSGPVDVDVRVLNGSPAGVLRIGGARPPYASLIVVQCEVDDEGRITVIRSVLASRKLTELGALRAR